MSRILSYFAFTKYSFEEQGVRMEVEGVNKKQQQLKKISHNEIKMFAKHEKFVVISFVLSPHPSCLF